MFVEHGSMALEQNNPDGNVNEANNQGVSLRIYPPLARPFCRIWEGSKKSVLFWCIFKGIGFCRRLMEPEERSPLCRDGIRLSVGLIFRFEFFLSCIRL